MLSDLYAVGWWRRSCLATGIQISLQLIASDIEGSRIRVLGISQTDLSRIQAVLCGGNAKLCLRETILEGRHINIDFSQHLTLLDMLADLYINLAHLSGNCKVHVILCVRIDRACSRYSLTYISYSRGGLCELYGGRFGKLRVCCQTTTN